MRNITRSSRDRSYATTLGEYVTSSPVSPFSYIELHHVHGPDRIVVAESEVKILQGFLLAPMSQNRVGYGRMDPTSDGIGVPAVPQIMDCRFGIAAQGFCRGSPTSCQGVLVRDAALRVQEIQVISGWSNPYIMPSAGFPHL